MSITGENKEPGTVHVVEFPVSARLFETDKSPRAGEPVPVVSTILAGDPASQQQCHANTDESFQLGSSLNYKVLGSRPVALSRSCRFLA